MLKFNKNITENGHLKQTFGKKKNAFCVVTGALNML